MRLKGSDLKRSSTKLNAKSSSSPLKTGVTEKRERNAMHHSSPSSDSSDFLKQRSGVELLLLFLSSSLSLSLCGFLRRRGNARAHAPPLSGFLALSLLYSCCGFPFSPFEHEALLAFKNRALDVYFPLFNLCVFFA